MKTFMQRKEDERGGVDEKDYHQAEYIWGRKRLRGKHKPHLLTSMETL